MGEDVEAHVLLVALGTHGHFIPGLHLANTLSHRGLHVTFATSASALRRLPILPSPFSPRLSFAPFSDGHDHGFQPGNDVAPFLSQFEHQASKAIHHLIHINNSKNPFTFVLYSLLTPWMAPLARSFNLPSALFWNQSASVFAIYYHFFNGGYRHLIHNAFLNNQIISLPGLPLLTSNNLPSLCHPSNSNSPVLKLIESHFQLLNQQQNMKILINSFHDLEAEAVQAMTTHSNNNVELVPIGPVIDITAGGDDLGSSDHHISAWLNSKPKSSVVYVSFGSIAAVSAAQLEEIGRGLLDSGRPFLWVMRKLANGSDEKEMLTCREEAEAKGNKVVPWCSQVEVLKNAGTGCFLTHCGWNSSLESLECGVPVVAFPRWTDQGTNAKIIHHLARTRRSRDACCW